MLSSSLMDVPEIVPFNTAMSVFCCHSLSGRRCSGVALRSVPATCVSDRSIVPSRWGLVRYLCLYCGRIFVARLRLQPQLRSDYGVNVSSAIDMQIAPLELEFQDHGCWLKA